MDKIERILKKIKPEVDFNSSQDFIEDGLLDSLELIELIEELEEEFEISIDPMDIVPENFENAAKIYELVKKNGGN